MTSTWWDTLQHYLQAIKKFMTMIDTMMTVPRVLIMSFCFLFLICSFCHLSFFENIQSIL